MVNFILNLALVLMLAINMSWYYEHHTQTLSNRRRFAQLLPGFALTTALLITIVQSSLALSLGLIGALSMVRFRSAIKEPEELLYLCSAIAIGLGIGAEQRWLTLVGALILLSYMAARVLLARRWPESNLYLNLTLPDETTPDALFQQVNARLLAHVPTLDFRRVDTREGVLYLTYFLTCDHPQTLNDLMDDLKQHFPIRELSFVQSEG